MTLAQKTLVVDARMIHASGIGTDLQNLLPYLKNHFIITLLGDPKVLGRFSWAAGLRIIEFTKPIYSIAEQVLLPIMVPRCDYFFSPHYNVPVLPLKASRRIVLIHDVYHLAFSKVSLIHKLYARFLLQSAVNLSHSVVTISEFSRSEILRYLNVGSKRIHKIGLGVDHALYKPSHAESVKTEVQNLYSLPAQFILFVGNVKPHKNLKNLVMAFSKLADTDFQDLKLVIVGKKDGFITGDKSLFELIEELNLKTKVLFTGYVDTEHLPVVYSLAKLFVFPSLYEGFGLPPLEAMASGCPTVISDAASMPEVCKDSCYYFNGTKPDDIAAAIYNVLQNPGLGRALAAKGAELVKEYTWERSAAELREIIQQQ